MLTARYIHVKKRKCCDKIKQHTLSHTDSRCNLTAYTLQERTGCIFAIQFNVKFNWYAKINNNKATRARKARLSNGHA